jgi:hypothetical protein
MTSKAKERYGREGVGAGAETQVQDRSLDLARRDNIRRRAYEIYLERGSVPGRVLEDWLQAERELTADESKAASE